MRACPFCTPPPQSLSFEISRARSLSLIPITDQATTRVGQSAKVLTESGLDHLAVLVLGE
jgi:hypothetical protein